MQKPVVVNCGTNPPEPIYLTAKEVAAIKRVELRTVQRWVSRGLIPFERIGRTIRFRRSAIIIDSFPQKQKSDSSYS